ncbi:glycosyltransferase family 4 protein [Hyunsoonleella sp. SJ7]|uniref:Glycosyltransferase family 4 protein n=1 Tax=Hyunsoonleella aquatilis TaxID=2762758 RepID=A0A923KJT5_9FLAO|nr:glycosyltransferase family 4 protein [Hyunsoonleella aquatilis]MBC3757762.1 glycosyltransferase family 4 protein [Hyunsoonleella aquatilis]
MLKRRIKKSIKSLQAVYNFLLFRLFEASKIRRSDLLFILPYFQTGGAERVHLNIIKSLQDKSICILFTHNSATENFKNEFSNLAKIIEVNTILTKNNSYINQSLKKVICKSINQSRSIISVFGSNTNFFYEVLPDIKKSINKLDLIHAISGENPTIVQHYLDSSEDITHRIVINKKAFDDVSHIYKSNSFSEELKGKIKIIENAIPIDLNDTLAERDVIRIGFVGRWSKEKRPEIFLKIASEIKKIKPEVEFEMVGIGMKSNVSEINRSGAQFLGEITDAKRLDAFYKSLTFILTTSSREGFPMVIPEAMAHGVIPISTNVGGINEHLISFENGVLIDNYKDENEIVTKFIDTIDKLINDKGLKTKIAKNAFSYSRKHFNISKFNQKYRNLVLGNKGN